MKKGNLFISYSYIARERDIIYHGFGNMIGHRLLYAPQGKEHIEFLQEETDKHCCKTLGMETATTTILWWKVMDGD